jgi:hypothetical protein
MNRKRQSFALLLALAIAVLAAAAAAQEPKMVPRLLAGTMTGRFVFEGPAEGPWTSVGDLTGTLRHLGLSRMFTSHLADPATGALNQGTFRIVAANGDEIHGTYTGVAAWVSGSQVLATAVLVIKGGTGRFAGATGTITASFLETFDDPTYYSAKSDWTLSGIVNY